MSQTMTDQAGYYVLKRVWLLLVTMHELPEGSKRGEPAMGLIDTTLSDWGRPRGRDAGGQIAMAGLAALRASNHLHRHVAHEGRRGGNRRARVS